VSESTILTEVNEPALAGVRPSATADGARDPARKAALDWLMGRINYERTAVIPYHRRQLKLDRMRQLLVRLGQPDAGLKIVHVAGTKGKGSTAAMIAAVLTAAGYRTGVYSSPHLERIEERFVVDGDPCTAAELVALVEQVQPVVRVMDEEAAAAGSPRGGPTFFDLTTALAMVHFAQRQVDAVVLEVGLGGRLDSTNVCLPVVSVITSISRDHTRQLGDTLVSIAREKAGIIKPGVPVVCGVTDPEPQEVIAGVAREHGCRMIQAGRDFQFRYRPPHREEGGQGEDLAASGTADQRFASVPEVWSATRSPLMPPGALDFECTAAGHEHQLDNIHLAMHGWHQAANAAVALAVVAELRHQGWCISMEAMRLGLGRAVLPARIECFPVAAAGSPTIVLDAAHNEASIGALVGTVSSWPPPARRTLIVSLSRDKDVAAIVRLLAPAFDRFIVTQYQENPRALQAEQLAEALREARAADVIVCPTPHEAWKTTCQTTVPGELVTITGSFFLAAEMRPLVVARGRQNVRLRDYRQNDLPSNSS
jgi:dihydrofolate synthase/folylpolyglutamate synthase